MATLDSRAGRAPPRLRSKDGRFRAASADDPAAARDACDACGKTFAVAELKRCSRCRAAAYCSTACQRTAWPRHKDHCRRAPKAAPAPAAPAPAPAAAPAPAPATTTIKRTDFKPAKNEWALFDEHSSRGFGVKETT